MMLGELDIYRSGCPFVSFTWLASFSILGALYQKNNLDLKELSGCVSSQLVCVCVRERWGCMGISTWVLV